MRGNSRLGLWGLGVAVVGLFCLPATSQAYWEFLPGTVCQPANETYLSGGHVYEGIRFVNPESSDPWDLQIAMCATGAPGNAVRVLYVDFSGERSDRNWCRLYSALYEEEIDFEFANGSGESAWLAFVLPVSSSSSNRDTYTLECLLHPGTSLDRIRRWLEEEE